MVIIEYDKKSNDVYLNYSYKFVNHKLKEICEAKAIDPTSENYRQFMNEIIKEQLLYAEKLGLPEMSEFTVNGITVNSNVYKYDGLIVEFLRFEYSGLWVINKSIKIQDGSLVLIETF